MKLDKTEIELLQEEIKNLQRENQSLKDTVEVYQSQLEKVIEYHSVERYRAIVQKNREAAGTTSQVDY
ncbi:hypothetical protein [Vagococcus fluvialis]|uniref:hypothetical protein n=1 Tax=Vagococcus fluvialis TaxID=2738 RepID=UPI00378C5D8A